MTKQDSSDDTLSISACQALIALVENGLWDISDALSTFSSSLSSIKYTNLVYDAPRVLERYGKCVVHSRNSVVAATAIGRLLLLDMKYNRENRTIYPFTLHAPQHPFIMILNRDKHSWRFVLNEMTSFVNHRDPQYVQEHMYTKNVRIHICIMTLKVQVFQNPRKQHGNFTSCVSVYFMQSFLGFVGLLRAVSLLAAFN